MLTKYLFALLSLFLLWSFPARAAAAELTVSAAMSLKAAFTELGRLYEAKHGPKVIFNFGASGDLARQIEGGAPVDVFASAAQKDMDALEAKGLLSAGSRSDFAANELALIIPRSSSLSLKSFEGLSSASVNKIAAGNPKTSPAGRYAEETFRYFKLGREVSGRLIYAETVRQVLDYVGRGEVDAGVVFTTDAVVRAGEVKIAAIAPVNSHRPIAYPIAVVKGTKNEAGAKAFVSLALSPEGKKILSKYGFKAAK